MRPRDFSFLLLAFSALLCYVGCSDDSQRNENVGYSMVEKLYIDILPIEDRDALPDDGDTGNDVTRHITTGTGTNVKTLFVYGDTMGIFPDGGYQIPFVIPLEPGETAGHVEIFAQGWMTKDSLYYSVYMPFNFYNRHYDKIPWDYRKILCQSANNNSAHLAENIFMACDTTLADSGDFHASLRMMGNIVRARIRIKDAGTYSKVVIVTQGNTIATHGYYDLFDTPEDNGEAPTNNQPFHPSNMTDFAPLYLGTRVGNGPPSGIALTANLLATFYFALPEMDVRGQTLTCYLWTSSGTCYTGTCVMNSGDTGFFKRNTINTIQFNSVELTSVPDVYINPYTDQQDLSGVAIE